MAFDIDKMKYLNQLHSKMNSYYTIDNNDWHQIVSLVEFQELKKEEVLIHNGEVARKFFYLCEGALRAYILDEEGNSYNKNLFLKDDFAGSTVSMLQETPSNFTIEALSDSLLISLNYKRYRELINQHESLKNFYIAYLERNWVIEKEEREVSIVMKDATSRYLQLLNAHPEIEQQVPQRHIASHLGITPTQLSRIRKNMKKNRPNQPM